MTDTTTTKKSFDKDKMLDKLRKLLEKADENKNPSAAEREQCMKLAQKIMDEYDLTIVDAYKNLSSDSLLDKIESWTFNDYVFYDYMSGDLLRAVSKLYSLRYYRTTAYAAPKTCRYCKKRGTVNRETDPRTGKLSTMNATCSACGNRQYTVEDGWAPVLVGLPEKIEAAMLMFDWLTDCIHDEAYDVFDKDGDKSEADLNGFCYGAAMEVCNTATRMMTQGDDGPGTALMVIRDNLAKAADDYIKKNVTLTTSRARGPALGGAGISAGMAYGKTISLNKQIGAPSSNKITAK